MRRKWKFIVPALLLGALVIAGLAYSASGPNEQLAHQDRVYGGGNFTPPSGIARTFAVDAHASANGVAAYGDIEFGVSGAVFRHEQVTCLAVSGNRATIGGIITQADSSLVGDLVLMVLTDNGPITSTTPDSSTFQEIGPPDDPAWPAGFPNVCPSPSAAVAMFGLDNFPLSGGDVVVQDATG